MQERELKMCPMCGSARISVHRHTQRRAVGFKAMCCECGLSQTGVAHGSVEAAASAWNRRAQASAEPMFWVRLCSDNTFEGPIHNARIEEVRKQSGAWSPLYLGAAPQQSPLTPEQIAAIALVPGMLEAYIESIKMAGTYDVFHYIPEIENARDAMHDLLQSRGIGTKEAEQHE